MSGWLTEYALDGLFRNHVARSTEFREWLIDRTKFAGVDAELVDGPWLSRWEEPLPDAPPATTIFLVFRQSGLQRRFALQVENRRSRARLEAGHAERCDIRAGRWRSCRDCDDHETILIAPSALYERHRAEADRFHRFISYEDVGEFIPEFT